MINDTEENRLYIGVGFSEEYVAEIAAHIGKPEGEKLVAAGVDLFETKFRKHIDEYAATHHE